MEQTITQIFVDGALAQLSGLIGLAIFFMIVGLREIRNEHPQGFFYLTLSLFFVVAHFFQMANFPDELLRGDIRGGFDVWTWIVLIFAPALVALFVVRGLIGLAFAQGREGLVKLFFGSTLLCFLFMLGTDWPIDVKGILTLVWLTLLLRLELSDTPAF